MKKFKFRAECLVDAYIFLTLPSGVETKNFEIKTIEDNLPDVEVMIETFYSERCIKEAMRRMKDSHVM